MSKLPGLSKRLSNNWVVSFLVAFVFFVLCLFIFRPGYMVNDDAAIISLASGYLGNVPVPFLVYSNVTLGLLLDPLYALNTGLNWVILFLIFVNFISVWALIFLILSRPLQTTQKIAGVLIVMASDSLFLLNITYTIIGAFACIAGFTLIIAGTQKQSLVQQNRLVGLGIVLIMTGSLIRLETVFLVLLIILPGLVWMVRSFDLRKLVIALATATFTVGGFYFFDRAYVHSSPDWNSYDIYNKARSTLQDSPRIKFMIDNIDEVGWDRNDLKLFQGFYFADKKIYSLENLQYLVDHVRAFQEISISPLVDFYETLSNYRARSYLLMMACISLVILLYKQLLKAAFPFLSILGSLSLINIYLIWVMRDPNQVFLPSLATGVIFGLYFLDWAGIGALKLSSFSGRVDLKRIALIFSFSLVAMFVLIQSIQTTQRNINEQFVYHQILSDLDGLQSSGKILPNALIVSPSNGIPLEWANPLILDFPKFHYVDLGWLTYSPPYYEVLRQFDISSLTNSFYHKENVYLLANMNMANNIQRLILDKNHVSTSKTILYSQEGVVQFGYGSFWLFKFEKIK